MKRILLGLTALLLSSSAFSGGLIVDIKCESLDIVSQNRFELEAEVDINGNNAPNRLTGTLALTNAGNEGETRVVKLGELGTTNYFAPGELALNEVFHYQAVNKESDLRTINLLIGYPGNFSSSIRTADGREYRAQCSFDLN